MRKSARNQPLPRTEAARLAKLNGSELRGRCLALYNAGWTLSAIGNALDRPRSTVRSWVLVAPSTAEDDIPTPQDRSYIPKKPISPGLQPSESAKIKELAPIARRYRAKLSDSHPSTVANQELTRLCRTLHALGVPLQELADTAGVSYRAMYRRVRNVR